MLMNCTKKQVAVYISLGFVAAFLYLHYQQYGFNKPTAKTVYVTLKSGLNKTKNFISAQVNNEDVAATIQTIQDKINNFVNKINVRKLLNGFDSSQSEAERIELDLGDVIPFPIPDSSLMHEKWIVVTSSSNNMSLVNRLKDIPGWKVVIVENNRSPTIPKIPGVVILTMEDQQESGFETARYLKNTLFLRKNIGYLYAIQHGASMIYDTDLHSFITNIDENFKRLEDETEYLSFGGSHRLYNSFSHFGQNKLWPRGYPIDLIKAATTDLYESCKYTHGIVQQGIVQGDPDLDAIQRLTFMNEKEKIGTYFDTDAPLVVAPSNAFVPYNSLNTIHYYDAFFSLLLPQSVTPRVSDIWRGFITQRMIWDLGCHVAFLPIKSRVRSQTRNFVRELREEEDLYLNSHILVDFLENWDCESDELLARYFTVFHAIYKHGLIGISDLKLVRAWIRDLVRIGYMPSKLQASSMQCRKSDHKSKKLMGDLELNQRHVDEYYKSLTKSTKHNRLKVSIKMANILSNKQVVTLDTFKATDTVPTTNSTPGTIALPPNKKVSTLESTSKKVSTLGLITTTKQPFTTRAKDMKNVTKA